ncbi:TrbI/VirB10 family protein [Sphingopyxis indica]|uniref:TrbI/VirB10 family protein n=1 Tax=Sphingopyxis indica TaxID=436663 RepID=UPI0029394292|nr:TrbI/VirB10 family protein [Sphingopyxis indica]
MTDAADEDGATPAKVDPGTLALRGRPRRVVRFRRDVIMGLAACAIAGTVAAAWLSLRPSDVHSVPSSTAKNLASASAPPEALDGMPSSYADMPQLGPAPGRAGRLASFGTDGGFAVSSDETRASARNEERERNGDAERAARASAIMIGAAPRTVEYPGLAKDSAPIDGDIVRDPVTGRPKDADQRAFAVRGTESGDRSYLNPHRLAAPPSPYLVQAGSVIAASLITGLNSELPGLVTAQVTQNVHDSITGRTLLIPQGTRLIGRYDDDIALGQKRALVVWERLILPNGASLEIDDMPASDTQGFSGLSDRIDQHEGKVMEGVVLATLLGVGTEIGRGDDESSVARAIRESAQDNGSRAGDQLVGRSLDIQPTLIVRPGWAFRIVVHKDLILPPWDAAEAPPR